MTYESDRFRPGPNRLGEILQILLDAGVTCADGDGKPLTEVPA